MQKKINKICLAICGMILLAIGLNTLILVDLGLSPFDSMTCFVQSFFQFSEFGNAAFFLHLSFTIPLFLLMDKSNKSIAFILLSILSVFIYTRFINLFSCITTLTINSNIWIILYFILGFISLSLGLLLIAKANIIIPPYDKSVVEIAHKLNLNLGMTRLKIDSCILLCVFILATIFNISVPFSFGTIIITLLTGSMMKFEEQILKWCYFKLTEKQRHK